VLAVNMQTSFMHPPFGFALFYLRSVAPTSPYKDHITGKTTDPVTTGQIYWGAIPFVIIQMIMVGLIIAFPQLVGHEVKSADTGPEIDIQQMLQDDAGKSSGGSFGSPTSPNQDDDAITKAIRDAAKDNK
jgi:hypothetical protein